MSETTNLHWSFNHDRAGQSPYFAQQFRSLIEGTLGATASGDRGGEVARYTILPNFRGGYKGPADGDDLSIGEVVIRRQAPAGVSGADHADRWFMIRNGKACPYPGPIQK